MQTCNQTVHAITAYLLGETGAVRGDQTDTLNGHIIDLPFFRNTAHAECHMGDRATGLIYLGIDDRKSLLPLTAQR